MFDYGNTLGNGWILKTYYKKLLSEMDGEFRHFRPQKQSMGDKLRKIAPKNSVADWVQKKESTCYICDRFQKRIRALSGPFFYLYEKDPDFKARIAKSKGFACIIWGALQQRGYQTVGEGKRDLFPGNFRDHAEKYGAYERRCGLAD